ncbi:MAG TPA: response regulator transcription factor [Thermoanaerobaculia bacterium]
MLRKKIGKTPKGKKRPPVARSRRSVTPSTRRSRDGGRVRLAIGTQPALLRDVLSRLLNRESDLEVVGQGHDEDSIVQVLKGLAPELLLLDYEALGPNSESIIARLRRIAPATRILVMATRSADEYVERVLRVGAAGLVGKQLNFTALLQAVRAVAAGQVWANRRAQALTLEHLTDFSAGAAEPEGQLTRREQQIVDGVTRGLRNKEIARQLIISEKTVKSHLNNIFQKLGLEGRFALAVFDQNQFQPKT